MCQSDLERFTGLEARSMPSTGKPQRTVVSDCTGEAWTVLSRASAGLDPSQICDTELAPGPCYPPKVRSDPGLWHFSNA